MVDWKKDISLGRKAKPEADVEPEPTQAETTEPEPGSEKAPFWKKELSLGRKPKAEAEPEAQVEPEAPAEPADAKKPFWKKEVSLGRKAKTDELADEADALPPEPSEDEMERLLTTALASLAAQDQEQAPVEAAAPVALPPAVEPVPVPLPSPEPEPEPAAAAPEPEPEPEPLPLAPEPEPEPVLPPAAEMPPAPVADEPVEEREQLHPVSWVDAVLHASAAEDEAPAVAAPQPPPAPEPVLPPAAELPPPAPVEPVVAPVVPVAQEPVVAPVVPLPAPIVAAAVVETAAQVVHPPVPAAELPPVPAEPKVPFWKKEIGGSKKAKEPKEPKQPKQAKEPKVKGESVPFWKMELGGSKKKKKAAGAAVVTAAAAVAAEPDVVKAKTPFWKLELGGSKKKKQQPQPGADAPVEAGTKKPLKKRRGFTMPTLVLPQRPQRAGSSAAKHKELVGLKIGASQIAAARVSNNGVSEVIQVAREEIDAGIVVGGELRDPEALAVALKEFFHANKLPKKGIRLGIANNRIGVRTFEITGIDDPKQLANAIRFRAQEALPIPIEEAVLDYHVLAESTTRRGRDGAEDPARRRLSRARRPLRLGLP